MRCPRGILAPPTRWKVCPAETLIAPRGGQTPNSEEPSLPRWYGTREELSPLPSFRPSTDIDLPTIYPISGATEWAHPTEENVDECNDISKNCANEDFKWIIGTCKKLKYMSSYAGQYMTESKILNIGLEWWNILTLEAVLSKLGNC